MDEKTYKKIGKFQIKDLHVFKITKLEGPMELIG